MKELSEFKEYYEKSLLNTVVVLEERRKEAVSRFFTYTCVASGAAGIIGMLILHFITAPENIYENAGVIVVLAFAILYIYSFVSREFIADFKMQIISKIVFFIDGNLAYSRDGCVSESYFIESGIFLRIPVRSSGEDYVCGKVGSAQIEFSELHTEYRTEHWDNDDYGLSSDGRYDWFGSRITYNYHTIFRGLFFVAHINKRFNSRTVVLPDVAESLLGGIGTKLQTLNAGRGQLVKMDNPEFERAFVVYSDDQLEAHLILNQDLMGRILELRREINRKISLSFTGSRVYIAIRHERNILEPRIFQTLLNFSLFQDYFQILRLPMEIVEGLRLDEIGAKGG